MRRKTLANIWEEEEYIEDPEGLISEFIAKFDDERIEKDDIRYMEVAKDFIKDMPKILDLVEDGSASKYISYVNLRFSK